jgi:hypothetical protein
VSDRGRCPPNWDDVTCLGSVRPSSKGIYEVRASHTAAAVSAIFDEPNLVSCAGLVPVLRLAERAGLHAAAQRRVRLPDRAGSGAANPGVKITSIVAGMVAGADSIDDLGVVRHGALPRLFGGIRAPSTLARFFVGSLGAMCVNSMPWPARHSPVYPAQTRRGLWLHSGAGIASPAGDAVDTDRRPGDRWHPAAPG